MAEQVATALLSGRILASYHRDYCGMGLQYLKGTFVYGEVWDGQLQSWNTFENRPASVVTFQDQAAFVAWLGAQSDATLDRREMAEPFYWNNQTVTRQRLLAFAACLASEMRPAWASNE
ncbi:hypothetical protein [Hymenobacter volaticus]|uniref:Uncharacterized protein n=1 Tax=Hymenobacter volaticus TaxID=2932254 RepID=A0ABY4G8N5_9BACT|nr:hypothetical protein [Hymenobacter volaticus]UOQ67274.1 hypothetical protein MUN86_05120 [Hymenobacter volaticus]